jgi:hypothetical protein
VSRSASEHALSFITDRGGGFAPAARTQLLANRGNCGLIEDNALAANEHQCIGSPEANGEVVGEEPAPALEHYPTVTRCVRRLQGLTLAGIIRGKSPTATRPSRQEIRELGNERPRPLAICDRTWEQCNSASRAQQRPTESPRPTVADGEQRHGLTLH